MIRTPILRITAHKADQGGANVYSYLFTYGAPMCYHGAEIPYAFANATDNSDIVDEMSGVWASFARTGEPSAEGVPTWEPYTREGGATMILGAQPELVHNHDLELLNLLQPGFEY